MLLCVLAMLVLVIHTMGTFNELLVNISFIFCALEFFFAMYRAHSYFAQARQIYIQTSAQFKQILMYASAF